MLRHVTRLVKWTAAQELIVLLGLLLISAGTWGFIELAGEVVEGNTEHFDKWVLESLRRPGDPSKPIGPEWFTELTRDVTSLGGAGVLALITGAVVGYLYLDRRRTAMWFVLAATVSGFGVGYFLKLLFGRERPDANLHLAVVRSPSFPSGHSMMSAIVYLTLGVLLARLVEERRLKLYCLTVAVVLTGLIGASRVYLGVHYPTDVLAGWNAGLVWATLCWLCARYLQRMRGDNIRSRRPEKIKSRKV